jgi:hypothetical protein
MTKTISRTQEEETDHNLLITLNNKVDEVTQSLKEMNDGMRTRLRDVEMRVNTIETIVDKVDPITTHSRFIEVERQVGYIKFTLYIIGVIAVIISWTTGIIGNIITIFNK